MRTLFYLPVFRLGETSYYWEDVVLAAMAWEDWRLLRDTIRAGLACAKRMRDLAQWPSDEEIDSSMREFRYQNGLISAEDVEVWLKKWGLTTLDWMKYICMSVLRRKWAHNLTDIMKQFSVRDGEIDQHMKAEGICSGELLSWCRKLAIRVSLFEKYKKEWTKYESDEGFQEKMKELLKGYRSNVKKSGQLSILTPKACREKLEYLVKVDLCFQRFCERVFTEDAINEQIRFHNFDWIRIDCLRLSFPDEQMAKEALLCVKQDGEHFDELAARIQGQIHEDHFYLDCLDSTLHTHFLYAQKGELIGPITMEGNPTLFLLRDKAMPSLNDPHIKQRAQEKILNNTIDHELHNRVHWEDSFYKE